MIVIFCPYFCHVIKTKIIMKKSNYVIKCLFVKSFICMLALWCVSLPEVLAQGTNASIVGKVVDENGEAIIGATVIVKK